MIDMVNSCSQCAGRQDEIDRLKGEIARKDEALKELCESNSAGIIGVGDEYGDCVYCGGEDNSRHTCSCPVFKSRQQSDSGQWLESKKREWQAEALLELEKEISSKLSRIGDEEIAQAFADLCVTLLAKARALREGK